MHRRDTLLVSKRKAVSSQSKQTGKQKTHKQTHDLQSAVYTYNMYTHTHIYVCIINAFCVCVLIEMHRLHVFIGMERNVSNFISWWQNKKC